MKLLTALLLAFALMHGALAHGGWSDDQQGVIDRMTELSQTMRVGGGGGEAYAAMLADGFTRWTVGSTLINHREDWMAGIAGWFDEGWRVIEGTNEILEIDIHGAFATTRRVVRETFQSPDGETSTYQSGVVEVWVRSGATGQWVLLRASVTSKIVEDE